MESDVSNDLLGFAENQTIDVGAEVEISTTQKDRKKLKTLMCKFGIA